jgi:hypothetical protein
MHQFIQQEHHQFKGVKKEVVIDYVGRKLEEAEKKYTLTERECLAVLCGLREFKPYLKGKEVTIYTDHAALKWILTRKHPPGRLVRWLALMQSFNFTIQHRPGNKIPRADYISRSLCDRPKLKEREIDYNSLVITDDKIVNNVIPPERTEIDDYVDEKLMINSILSENYFREDIWRYENKINANRQNQRKGIKKNVKVKFVDICEDTDSHTTTQDESSSDDTVQFVDSSEDTDIQSTRQDESSSDDSAAATSSDAESSQDN